MSDFTQLYSYNTSSGVVIPQYDEVRANVVLAFKEAFGNDIDTTTQTAVGRLIEAVATMLRTVIQVNAQNANNFNPRVAIGSYIDNIAALFDLARLTGESDTALRSRLLSSQSRGTGFVESIMNAVSKVSGVTYCSVLDNGYDVPITKSGVVIDPHSIIVCVDGGDSAAVADAIYATKSAGCGYTTSIESVGAYGGTDWLYDENWECVTVTDSANGSENYVYFFRPIPKSVSLSYTISGAKYTGTDIETDAQNLVNEALEEYSGEYQITAAEIISYVASAGLGITVRSFSFDIGVESFSYLEHAPYEKVTVTGHDITVV